MAQRVFYTIRKLLKFRCLKWDHITNLDIKNTSYGQKKGREPNLQFDSWPLKVRNHFDFLRCRSHARYCWKTLNKGYNFVLNFIIGGLHTKLWGSKVVGVLTLAISGLPLKSPGTKNHLDVGLMERHRVYYKGEGGGFPQVRIVVSLMSPSFPMACPSTKSVQIMR
jgi:hypothetical protein